MRKILACISLFVIFNESLGQNSLSFYHLGNATFQNSNFNPVFIPDHKVMLGLPVLSGFHYNFNSKLSYSDVITKTEDVQNIDVNKALGELQRNNMLSLHANISLFHLAIKNKTGSAFSIFANERIEIDLLYSRNFMEMIAKGNAVNLDEKIDLDRSRTAATHFREIGIGYMIENKNLNIKVGARAKYLQGFFNASTPESMTVNLETDGETYELIGNLENAQLRTSGIDIAQGNTGDLASHLIFNGNRGFALDLGFEKALDRYSSIAISINDIGFISWKEDIKNYTLSDSSFVYSGVELKGLSDLEQAVQDSLIDRFDTKETSEAYTTLVGPRLYGSYIYKTPIGGNFMSSGGIRYVQNQLKWLFGVGYQHNVGNWFTVSANVTRLPQQFLNLGAAFAIKGGPIQWYVAADQVATWDLTKFQSFDLRLGLNFVFDGRQRDTSGKGRASSPFVGKGIKVERNKGKERVGGQSFLGNKAKVKGVDGIYNIIRRQKRRPIDEINSPPSGKNPNRQDYIPKKNEKD